MLNKEYDIKSSNNSIDKDENKNNIYIGGYDEDLVINKNYLLSLDNTYKCNICYKIMIDPVECEECGHNFCYNCINSSDCPYGCKNKIIKHSSLAIKNLLSQIRFKCPNKGCTVSFDYSKIEKHNNECQFKSVKCPNKDCNKIIIRKDLDNHINNECEYLLINCQYCNYEFFKKDIEHHENTCKLLNKGRDSINYDTNNIGFDEHLKRLSKNLNEIIKNNQKLAENSEKNNNDNNQNNIETYPYRISIRKSIVPGLEGDEFLDIIQKEIELKIKNYYTDFHNNFSKLLKEIDDIKEVLKHYINNIIIDNNFNQKKKNNDINEKNTNYKNKENEEEIKKYLNDLIEKTEENLKNLIKNYNKKFSTEFSSFNNILLYEKKDSISDEINENNKIKNKSDMFYIINNIVNNLKNYICETNKQVKILSNNFIDNLNSLINYNNNNNIQKIEKSDIEKSINNFIGKDIKLFEDLKEKIKNNIIRFNKEEIKEINEDNVKIKDNLEDKKINENNKKNSENDIISLNNNITDIDNSLNNVKNNIKQTINIINEKFTDISDLINKQRENTKISPLEISSVISFTLFKTQIQNNKENDIQYKDNSNKDSFNTAEFIYLINTNDNQLNPFPLLDNLENRMTSLENNSKEFSLKLKEKIKTELSKKLIEINTKVENDIDKKIEKVFSLKYCKECEKIDYFYGFINCSLCNEENCKQCIVICTNCKNFCCLKCCLCKKCDKIICNNCRILCVSCNNKYCQLCMINCPSCKKNICSNCIMQCIICNKNNCNIKCSKICHICMKNYCKNCLKNIKFSKCHLCNNNICENCFFNCKEHDKINCKNCCDECDNCKNYFCKKSIMECYDCKLKYCMKCGINFGENNICNLCKNIYCKNCITKNNNFKCISCLKKICNKCCSKCISCSNIICKECAHLCKGCNNLTCNKCLLECACEKEKFCNKCFQTNETIFPHECVYFLNNCAITESKKTRGLKKIPNNLNIEAKFSVFMNDISDSSFLLVGIIDNSNIEEENNEDNKNNKNIFALNVNNGDKYSSEKGFEGFLDFEFINKGFNEVYLMIKEHKLFLKINKSIYKWAYDLKKENNYWFYTENNINNSSIKFIFVRKIK